MIITCFLSNPIYHIFLFLLKNNKYFLKTHFFIEKTGIFSGKKRNKKTKFTEKHRKSAVGAILTTLFFHVLFNFLKKNKLNLFLLYNLHIKLALIEKAKLSSLNHKPVTSDEVAVVYSTFLLIKLVPIISVRSRHYAVRSVKYPPHGACSSMHAMGAQYTYLVSVTFISLLLLLYYKNNTFQFEPCYSLTTAERRIKPCISASEEYIFL
ncbi:hypothetical protein ACJX0J_033254 [Zea mays]